ncbi:MAG: AAA family ATPase, partial [Planctomycetaceae bacterium]|nr:AAA family ATPase [Planctomycetaceae bacterium]
MLIRSLNVQKYGVCRNTEISDLNDDLVVIYGPNEAGKTTCMEFIRGVFYGLSNDGRGKYVRGNANEGFGGSLSIEGGDGQTWVVSRELSVSEGNLKERLDVLIGGQLHSAATMNRELLNGVDHDVFKNVFTVGLDELQHLNTLNATEAAEFLYEMTTGMDRVSLGKVLRGVTQTRHSIYDQCHDDSEIRRLETRVEQLDQLIHCDLRQLESWSQLRNELHAGRQDIDRITDESNAVQRSVKRLETATIIRDVWNQRCQSLKQLDEAPHLSESLAEIVSTDSVQLLRARDVKRGELSQEIQELTEKISAVKLQVDSVPINVDVAENIVRVRAICEHSSWLVSLQDQVASLKKDVAALSDQSEFELSNGLFDRIPGPMPEVDRHILRAMSQVEAELIFAEERCAEQASLVDSIQGELEEVEQSWMDLVVANAPQLIWGDAQGVASSSVGFDESGFEQLLADLGSEIGLLRTRLELDDQKTRVQRELESTEEYISSSVGGLPSGLVLAASAGLTVTGFAAFAVGFAFPAVFSIGAATGTLIGMLGVVLFGFGVGCRMLESLRRKQKVAVATTRRSLLKRQNAECQSNIEAIELINDFGGASWEIQLRDLREQHSLLESMVPMLGKLKTVNARLQLSKTRLADCQRNADEAQKSWVSVLGEQGLPLELQPDDLHAIADNSDIIAQRKRRLDDRKAELARREADLADLVVRIEQILIDLDMQPESLEPANQLRQLSRLLNQQREAKQQRKILKKSSRKLRKKRRKIIEQLQELETTLNRVFVRAGVSDLAELEQLSQNHSDALELRSRCDNANDVILERLKDSEFGENELFLVLDEYNELELRDEVERLRQQVKVFSESLANLHEEQGQKKQVLQHLLDDNSLDAAKLERTVVGQQLADAQRRWRVWAITEFVLQQVRDIYESERQPETLVDAGQCLTKMSGGKYTRIWTPLDEDALYVDDASGQTWRIDVLSRGTRESVFICLRLALVNSYTKRGVCLPLILDDVLVNCDSLRAKHGVAMLKEFAEQGTQVFFFTCHNHLTEQFSEANADVRELTLREDVVAPDIHRFSTMPAGLEQGYAADVQLETGPTTLGELVLTDARDDSKVCKPDANNAESRDQYSFAEFEVGHEQDHAAQLAEDELAEDEVAEDEVAEDEVAEDEVAEDEVAEDEVAEDEVAEDEVA